MNSSTYLFQLSSILLAEVTASEMVMFADQFVQYLACRAVFDQREFDHFHIAVVVEVSFLVPHISNTAAHAGGEVAPLYVREPPRVLRHIFAAVVTDSLYDGDSTGVYARRNVRLHVR